MTSRYGTLDRETLAKLVPELLLTGHLIDRSGMTWAISEFGREEMVQIAVEEWAGASPIYAKRMQQALKFEGDDVPTIFKGLQLEIGAPPQFLDFRFILHDNQHGEFYLNYCGALCDVEPMGEEYVKSMCHDIEDPTFDATAVATNSNTKIRPIHRPPGTPENGPVCAWTVDIGDEPNDLPDYAVLKYNQQSHIPSLVLDPIDETEDGITDYSGEMVTDIDFPGFAHSALVRLADEVALQMHVLNRAFQFAIRQRTAVEDMFTSIATRQLIGHAGITAERLHKVLGLGTSVEDAARLLELHPLFNPHAYVDLTRDGSTISVRPSLAHEDEGWLSVVGPHSVEPLRAIVRAVDPHFDVEVDGNNDAWTAKVVRTEQSHPEHSEVAVTRFSAGVEFQFEPRKSLPLTVV